MILGATAASSAEGTYLENVLDSLKFLPVDLQRNMQLLCQLDAHADQLRITIDAQRESILATASESKKNPKPFDLSSLKKLRRLERKCIKLLDEKLIIAKECHKIANSHLTRIGLDMSRFEKELGPYQRDEEFEEYMSESINVPAKSQRAAAERAYPIVSSPAHLASIPVSPHPPASGDEPRLRVYGPASSEQTYCFCKQSSYGQMVACDDENCSIQWWHFKCAGIAEIPTGTWYCRVCTDRRQKELIKSDGAS
uniref:Inhibitor of growth protein n=1 Tax=Spongospora subterranea TaxID=70186 RepID=A0A0H5R6K8_9EUKA|eukprot:CRZ09412.1 hypothetical protein [Spongospora subterranea]